MKKKSFAPLFLTNLLGVINDNFLKTLASFTVMGWIEDPAMKPVFMGITAGALVLPYIFLSPLADRLTAVFSKLKVVRLAKWAELPIMVVAIIGFLLHSPSLVVGAVLLMGLQSALYSPSKYALVRDIGGVERISTGMGGMEGMAFLGVLLGTIVGSFVSDIPGDGVKYTLLAVFAVLGLVMSYITTAEEEPNKELHAVSPIRYFSRAKRIAARYPGMNAVIITLSVFWFCGAMLQMGVLTYGKEVMKLDSTHTGMLLCAAAIGIVAGQVIAGFIDKKRFLLGASILTGWIGAALLLVLYFVPPTCPVTFALILGVLAFDLGFFKLPFDTEIQKVVKGPKLNTMLAYFNQVSFTFMLFASVVYALLGFAFSPRAFFLALFFIMLIAPVYFIFHYKSVGIETMRWILFRRYKIEEVGIDEAAKKGKSLLILPNHPALVDPMLVSFVFHKYRLCPLCDEAFFSVPICSTALKTLEAVPVPDLRARRNREGAMEARGLEGNVIEALKAGKNVQLYPSGHIYVDGKEDVGTRQLAYNLCRDLPEGAEVITVRTTGLWGSIWSRKGRKSSPDFMLTLLKSIGLWLFVSPFTRRRVLKMEAVNRTEELKTLASTLSRVEFNKLLTDWYNDAK